jgi:hypothetical protein
MNWSPLKCPDIEATGIPLGTISAAPGSNYNQFIHQFEGKFAKKSLLRSNRETPETICKRLNRLLETAVIR